VEQGFSRPDALLLPTKHCLRSYFDLIDSLTSRKKRVLLFWELLLSDSQSVRDTRRSYTRRCGGLVRPQSATLLEGLLDAGDVPRLRLQRLT